MTYWVIILVICSYFVQSATKTTKFPHIQLPPDEYFLEFHMTRYFAGCFTEHNSDISSPVIPWIRHFNLLVTKCIHDWSKPKNFLPSSGCVYETDPSDPIQAQFLHNESYHNHYYNHFIYQHLPTSANDDFRPTHLRSHQDRDKYRNSNRPMLARSHVRIHVHTDKYHHEYFATSILPNYEAAGMSVILHSGGGDAQIPRDLADKILASPVIDRWIIEQNRDEVLMMHPKIVQIPIGICPRENHGAVGKSLRDIRYEMLHKKASSRLNHLPPLDTIHVHYEEHVEPMYIFLPDNSIIPNPKFVKYENHNSSTLTDQVDQTRSHHSSNERHHQHLHHQVQPPLETSVESKAMNNNPSGNEVTANPIYPTGERSSSSQQTATHRLLSDSETKNNQTTSSTDDTEELVHLTEEQQWRERKDRVLICFTPNFLPRNQTLIYTKAKCDICDFCPDGVITHDDIWRYYTQYKFIYSPFGNGPDCGRTWEIMILGAIPIIPYFPGAYGYTKGNLSAIILQSLEDLTPENLQKWIEMYPNHSGNYLYKLQADYWSYRLFYDLPEGRTAYPSMKPTVAHGVPPEGLKEKKEKESLIAYYLSLKGGGTTRVGGH